MSLLSKKFKALGHFTWSCLQSSIRKVHSLFVSDLVLCPQTMKSVYGLRTHWNLEKKRSVFLFIWECDFGFCHSQLLGSINCQYLSVIALAPHVHILRRVRKFAKHAYYFIHVCSPSVCPHEQFVFHWTDFMKFYIWTFFEKLTGIWKLHWKLTRITGSLNEVECLFMTVSRWIILRMRNVSFKSCRENQNTHFVFNNFCSRKSRVLWDNV